MPPPPSTRRWSARLPRSIGTTPVYVQSQLASVQYSVYQPVPLMANAPAATVQYLQTHASQFPGVSVEQVTERSYPLGGTTATHVLGYVGDITGTGARSPSQPGLHRVEPDREVRSRSRVRAVPARGRRSPGPRGRTPRATWSGTVRSTDSVQGDTLVTNLDADLQAQVQNALRADILADRSSTDSLNGGIHPPATTGAAIVMNVNNGQVLAMASYPTYDLNEWVGGISQAEPRRHRRLGAPRTTTQSRASTPRAPPSS